jgi:glycosyltransferase involved in cell wall biosynthesis
LSPVPQNKPLLVHCIDDLNIGGAETVVASTIRLLAPHYRQILVTLLPGDGPLYERVRPYLHDFVCLHARSKPALLRAALQLNRLLRGWRPNLVHAHLLRSGLVAKLACPSSQRLFYTLHSPYSVDAFSRSSISLFLEKWTARRRHHLLAVSQNALRDYCQYVPYGGPSGVLYNPIREEFFASQVPASFQKGETLRCVSVGSLKRAKNYSFALQAFAQARHLPVELDIWGDGPDREQLLAEMRQWELPNVRLCGQTADVASLLPQYHLFLSTSIYEGFGIAPLEAMAAGRPVACCRLPVFEEVMADVPLYFACDDPSSLVGVLESIVGQPSRLEQLGERGRAAARSLASEELYARRLMELYSG